MREKTLRTTIFDRLQQGKLSEALKLIDSYLQDSPDDLELQVQSANLCAKLGSARRAKDQVRLVLQHWPDLSPQYLSTLANSLFKSGDIEGAEDIYRRAANHPSPTSTELFDLAAICRATGKLLESESLYDRVIELSPGDAEAVKNRSELRRQTEQSNHLNQIRQLLASAPSWDKAMRLHFALGKELEDIGSFDEAFNHFTQGNDLRRAHLDYRVETDLEIMAALAETPLTYRDPDPSTDATTPIFVVGLPRTGTTLVERILICHPDVESVGESVAFPAAMAIAANKAGVTGRSAVEKIAAFAELNPRILAEHYSKEIERRHDLPPFNQSLDKLPLNYLHIGLIRAAYPGASIILLRRNHLDTIIALYRTLFAAAYPFSYDLREIATYLKGYERLINHWIDTVPNLHVVDYENLVSAQEQTTRELLDGCKLGWNPACLNPEQSTAPTTTASAVQVREPVHTRSVNQWQRYARQLGSIVEL